MGVVFRRQAVTALLDFAKDRSPSGERYSTREATLSVPDGTRPKQGMIRAERDVVWVDRRIVRAERGTIRVERGTIRAKRGVVRVERGMIRAKRGIIRVARGVARVKQGTCPGGAEHNPGGNGKGSSSCETY